jgi:small ligand-binding sensory domain FIST
MQWASALSRRVDARQAVAEAAEVVRDALSGPPDLALLFVSSHYASAFDAIPCWAQAMLSPGCLIGCSASGVVGAGTEVERSEALSIVAARLPGVELFPFHLELPPAEGQEAIYRELTGLRSGGAGLVLLSDPFSIDVEALLRGLDSAYPGVPKVGGLISGANEAGDGALFLGDRTLREGALGLGLRGRIALDTLVAQGCRPVGQPMIITRCRESVIYELNVGRPVDALRRLFEQLEPRDQELCRHSLFIGIEMSGGSHRYGQGDFLVRNLGGLDPKSGAMNVQGRCRDYQVVQFMLRDARTSAQDLQQRLMERHALKSSGAARGALQFSCVGRGQELFGSANHDSDMFCRQMGALPLGGFFASGEVGPVAGQSFLHGYTSVFGIFSDAVAAPS